MTVLDDVTTIYDEIRAERERAHAKHGDKSMESWSAIDYARLSILLEEVGEVAREFNDAELRGGDLNLTALRQELVQVAAMAAAWADACVACEYQPRWTDEVGTIPVCIIHGNNSKHEPSDDPHRPCLTIDPFDNLRDEKSHDVD